MAVHRWPTGSTISPICCMKAMASQKAILSESTLYQGMLLKCLEIWQHCCLTYMH